MDKRDWRDWRDPNRDYFNPNDRAGFTGSGWGVGTPILAPQILQAPSSTAPVADAGPLNSTEAFRRGAKENPFTPVFAAPKKGATAPGTSTIKENPLTPVISIPSKKVAAQAVNPLTPTFKDGGLVQGVKHYGKKC